MKRHSSKTVKTSKIRTSATKPNTKLKIIVRMTPRSSSVGKFAIPGRNLKLRFAPVGDAEDLAVVVTDDLRQPIDQRNCRSRDQRISSPRIRTTAVASHAPNTGRIEPARAA